MFRTEHSLARSAAVHKVEHSKGHSTEVLPFLQPTRVPCACVPDDRRTSSLCRATGERATPVVSSDYPTTVRFSFSAAKEVVSADVGNRFAKIHHFCMFPSDSLQIVPVKHEKCCCQSRSLLFLHCCSLAKCQCKPIPDSVHLPVIQSDSSKRNEFLKKIQS